MFAKVLSWFRTVDWANKVAGLANINIDNLIKSIFQVLGVVLALVLLVVAFGFALLTALAAVSSLEKTSKFFFKVAIGFDQVANACLDGNEDHTISGRIGHRIETGKATKAEIWLCKLLTKLDPRTNAHCVESIEHDEIQS